MFFNLTFLISLTWLFSIFLGLSASNYILCWVSLELNMLSFVSLLVFSKHSKVWVAMKYFLVQSFSSLLFFLGCLWSINSFQQIGPILIIVLILKLGGGPLHGWVINLAEDLTWEFFFLVSTFQKILPLFLILKITQFSLTHFVFLGALVASVGGLLSQTLKKLLVYSSVLGLAWMMASLEFSVASMFLFSYTVSFFYIAKLSKELNYSNLKNKSVEPETLFALLSLFVWLLNMAGVPPFMGFYMKLIILSEMMFLSSVGLILVLLMASGVFVYAYLQISFIDLAFMNTLSIFKSYEQIPMAGLSFLLILSMMLIFILRE